MIAKLTKMILLVLCISYAANAQTEKVLFIGNSYTGFNNLPQLVHDVAMSVGDTLIFDAHTPGGTRLIDHAVNTTAHAKINADNWDHVVLQAQSREPSWPDEQVETEVFPYARILCDSIRANDACTRPVFYMTWGRENGDVVNCAAFPPVCTYEGMDSLLNLRYREMGDDNEAYVSPVGAVWHYLRDNHPAIALYTSDGSHPSLVGSYAAACTFYTIFFEKDPTLILFNSSVPEADATAIKAAAKTIVFDNLAEWNVGEFDPVSEFSFTANGNEVAFTNTSTFADSFLWTFGDGETSTTVDPIHAYQAVNTYIVALEADKCEKTDISTAEFTIQTVATDDFSELQIKVFPSPTEGLVNIELGEGESINISVMDSSGRLVYQHKNIVKPGLQFELRGETGLYFLEVYNGMNSQVYKLIKK